MLESLKLLLRETRNDWRTLSNGAMRPDLGWIVHTDFCMERRSQGTQSRRKLLSSDHQFSEVPTWGDGAHNTATNVERNLGGKKVWEGGKVNSQAPRAHPRPPYCTAPCNMNGTHTAQKLKMARWTRPPAVLQHFSPGIFSHHWAYILMRWGRWEASKILSNAVQRYEENKLSASKGTKLGFKIKEAKFSAGFCTHSATLVLNYLLADSVWRCLHSPLSPGQTPVLPRKKIQPCQGLCALPISSKNCLSVCRI